MRRTKIVCTIGPASSDPGQLDRLAAAGMDVARLNFSHGTHAEHAQVMSSRLIRKVETTDDMIEEVEATLLGDGTVRVNDVLVNISGSPMWVTGTTNLLKLHRVGERR
jgi:pyruvate kinase